jgi:hypothetical protein
VEGATAVLDGPGSGVGFDAGGPSPLHAVSMAAATLTSAAAASRRPEPTRSG